MTLPTTMRLAILFHSFRLRGCLLALPAIAVWFFAAPAKTPAAEPWPTRPVTVLCPFAAGTSTDTLMRLVNASLSQRFGQNFIVERSEEHTSELQSQFHLV